jgi:hypothetical protein
MIKQALVMSILFSLSAAASAMPEQPKYGALPEQPAPVFGEKVAPTDFPQLIQMVRKELQPGGRWQYVPKGERPTLENRLGEMEMLLDGLASIDELSNDEKMNLLNAQEHANAILTRNDGERLICERSVPVGTHRAQVLCVTLAQRINMKGGGRQTMERLQQNGRKEVQH